MELNVEQKAVVETLQENILLTASAGTGKTNTMAARIARIVGEELAKAEEILCLTFTNKACKEMRERIDAVVGEKARNIVIRTFHGFCYDVIRQEAKRKTDLFADFIIFDEEDCKEVIRQVKEELGKNWDTNAMQRFISAVKETRIKEDLFSGDVAADYRKTVDYLCRREAGKLAALCQVNFKTDEVMLAELKDLGAETLLIYDKILGEAHGLDFTDLMCRTYELFRDEEVSVRWRDTFRYINVDEMQDTSLVEYKIISKLFGNNRLLLCGDYFQTIYEWRGSRPETVQQQFIRDYKPKVIVFYENYRATRLLLNASYDYLRGLFPGEVEKIYPKAVRAASPVAGEPVLLHGSYDLREEARWIYMHIQRLGMKDWSRICVLTRNNNYNTDLANAFTEVIREIEMTAQMDREVPPERIPFFLVDDFKFFRRQEIKDVLAFLKVAVNPLDSTSLERTLKRFGKGIGERTVAYIQSKEARQLGIRLTDFVDPVTHETGDHYGLLLQEIEQGNVVVFDVEATGTDTTTDEIIQIAAIRLNHDGTTAEKFMKYVKAGKSVGSSELVHHISDEKLAKEGEEPQKVFREFEEFVGDSVIVGHNVNYDISILQSEMGRLGMEPMKIRAYYDTLDIFRRFYPNLKNHKLEYLGEVCKVSHKSSHDAFDDICATGEILMYAIKNNILPTRESRCQEEAKYLKKFGEMTEKLAKIRELVRTRRPFELMGDIVNEFGIKAYYDERNEPKRVQYLKQMYIYLKDWDEPKLSPKDATQQMLKLAALSNSELDSMLKRNPKVPIITVHQAKGMEFDYVFLAGLMDNVFPSYMSLRDEDCTEDSRLFYVAITRAKKRLFLSWCQNYRRKYYHMSRFVGDISRKYMVTE